MKNALFLIDQDCHSVWQNENCLLVVQLIQPKLIYHPLTIADQAVY